MFGGYTNCAKNTIPNRRGSGHRYRGRARGSAIHVSITWQNDHIAFESSIRCIVVRRISQEREGLNQANAKPNKAIIAGSLASSICN
jgi:hypothetical protein